MLISNLSNAKQLNIFTSIKIDKIDPVTLTYAEECAISPTLFEPLVKPISSELFKIKNSEQSVETIEKINKTIKKNSNKNLISNNELSAIFHQHNFLKLVHSRMAMLYTNQNIKEIFFKSGGHLSLIDLPLIEL